MEERKKEGSDLNIYCYLVGNLIIIAMALIRTFSLVGLTIALVFTAVVYRSLLKQKEVVPASSSQLAGLVLLDVFIFIGIQWEVLQAYFRVPNFAWIAEKWSTSCWVLLLLGIFAGVLGKKKLWVEVLSGVAIGSALILLFWSNRTILALEFTNGGHIIFGAYLVAAAAWYFFARISISVGEMFKKRVRWMGRTMLVLVLFMLLFEKDLVTQLPQEFWKLISMVSSGWLAWWKVCLLTLGLLGCALIMFGERVDDEGKGSIGVDSLVFLALAGVVLIAKLLITNYSPFGWGMLGLFLVLTQRSAVNEWNGKKTAGIPNGVAILSALLFTLLAVKAIAMGLWMNVVVTALLIFVLYQLIRAEKNGERKGNRNWLVLISGVFLELLAWMTTYRYAPDNVILLVIIFCVTFVVTAIAIWPHPEKIRPPNYIKVTACVIMIGLSLILLGKYGTTIKATYDEEKQSISIEMKSRGKDNKIDSAYYYWSDAGGNQLTAENTLSGTSNQINVSGAQLTIVAVDCFGVRTQRTVWSPYHLF